MEDKPHLNQAKVKGPRTWRSRLWWVTNHLLFPVAAALIFLCCARFAVVPSGSMESTLDIGDRILINTVSTKLGPVPRGDIVVFKNPDGWLPPGENPPLVDPFNRFIDWMTGTNSSQLLVKRVIGVPGDHVACCTADGHLSVNGAPINEPYLHTPVTSTAPAAPTPFDVTVPPGHLWLMGDSRGNSADSLYHLKDADHGFVSEKQVIGTVLAVVSPLSRAGLVDTSREDAFFRAPATTPRG